jgi:dihydroorotase
MAESIGLERNIALLGYRGGSLHVPAVSLASSVEQCDTAKTSTRLTYGISVLNLLLTDEAASDYDVNAKVLPPLREERDRQALLNSIREGRADALISNHQPREQEAKQVEFPYAAFGVASLEVAFSIASTAVGDAHIVADYLGRKNRSLSGLPEVVVGSESPEVSLTFYLPEETYQAPQKCLASLGANAAVQGMSLQGKSFAIFCRGQWLES